MREYAIYSDQWLIKLISTGDTLAFTELYNRHKDKLYSFAFDLVGSHDKAIDLVHDVFLKIWEQRLDLAEKEIFSSYLFTMVRNFSIDYFRRCGREMLIQKELAVIDLLNQETPESNLLYKDLQNKVRQAIEQLPSRQREIYLLHKQEKLKYKEIAQKLDLSVSTVENHFSRAMVSIRIFLNSEYAGILINSACLFFYQFL